MSQTLHNFGFYLKDYDLHKTTNYTTCYVNKNIFTDIKQAIQESNKRTKECLDSFILESQNNIDKAKKNYEEYLKEMENLNV